MMKILNKNCKCMMLWLHRATKIGRKDGLHEFDVYASLVVVVGIGAEVGAELQPGWH